MFFDDFAYIFDAFWDLELVPKNWLKNDVHYPSPSNTVLRLLEPYFLPIKHIFDYFHENPEFIDKNIYFRDKLIFSPVFKNVQLIYNLDFCNPRIFTVN